MNEQPILVENKGHVRWIKLNRPEVMNAITPKMLIQLNEELKAADDSIDVRVVILTGAGYYLGRNFSKIDDYVGPISTAAIAAIVLFYVYRVITWKPRAKR